MSIPTFNFTFSLVRCSLNIHLISACVAFQPGIITPSLACAARLIISLNFGCLGACSGYIEKTRLNDKIIPERKPICIWLVTTSHSIKNWWKFLSEYGTTCSATFFFLRSQSRVHVATSAALHLLTSPSSFDSYLFFLAQLWYCHWKE